MNLEWWSKASNKSICGLSTNMTLGYSVRNTIGSIEIGRSSWTLLQLKKLHSRKILLDSLPLSISSWSSFPNQSATLSGTISTRTANYLLIMMLFLMKSISPITNSLTIKTCLILIAFSNIITKVFMTAPQLFNWFNSQVYCLKTHYQ